MLIILSVILENSRQMFADMSQFSSKWPTVLFAIVHFLSIIQRRAIAQPIKLCWTISICPIIPLLIDFKRQVDCGAVKSLELQSPHFSD